MHVLATQLHFLANRNTGLAIPPLFWPVKCIKIGGHVVLLSRPTVYSLYCAITILLFLCLEPRGLLGANFGSTFSISSISTSQVEVNTTSESRRKLS